jgi:16S rRNA (cytosine1402-N4)-methyltransferase
MVAEVLTALNPQPGGRYIDGTLGGGGHAEAILRASAPDGWLYGCDRDQAAVEAAAARLAPYTGRFELRRCNYSEVGDWIGEATCDGALVDLGVSSQQLDEPSRGFSFRHEGPLDMRMDKGQSLTAAHLVNEASPEELSLVFWELGQEPAAHRVARAIARQRVIRPIGTTQELAALVERVVPRGRGRIHPATRVFQALRMAVNDELGFLAKGLEALWAALKRRGRLAVISFHSLEGRVVKEFGKVKSRDYEVKGELDIPELRQPVRPQLRVLSKKAIQPSAAEVADNPRARSAQLRVMEKI